MNNVFFIEIIFHPHPLAGNLEASGSNEARLQFRPFVENRC